MTIGNRPATVRADGRGPNDLRPISFELGVQKWAEGSCRVRFGDTEVLCAATIVDRVPPHLRGKGTGWVTAEYSMLPRATAERTDRESVKGRIGGRTHEIQRLIGRSLRGVVDLSRLGERTITVDCDVLQADGGTRTASITGGYVALAAALITYGMERHLRGKGTGWVTAEYSMLPRATAERTDRESAKGRIGGRTHEIQRLIGRSLRGVVDLAKLGEKTVTVDCDVLQADGGTRCASITGGYVALALAAQRLIADGKLDRTPLSGSVAAVSAGVVGGVPLLDLDYSEDSTAEVDANVVMTGDGGLIEVQATAEKTPLSRAHLDDLLALAASGIAELRIAQQQAIDGAAAAADGAGAAAAE